MTKVSYAGNDFMMKVVKFGNWEVSFGMDVRWLDRRGKKGFDFSKVMDDWSDFYYKGHIENIWYRGIKCGADEVCYVYKFLWDVYHDWKKENEKMKKLKAKAA